MNTCLTPAAAFNQRLASLSPILRRAARAAVGTLSEYTADDHYQHIHLKFLERAAKDPAFTLRPDIQLITFANWRARSHADAGRTYTRNCPPEEIIIDEADGDEISSLDLIQDDSDGPEEQVIAIETHRELVAAIRRVRDSITDPVDARIFDGLYAGLTQSQIAAQLGISTAAVSQRKPRLAAALRAALTPAEQVPA